MKLPQVYSAEARLATLQAVRELNRVNRIKQPVIEVIAAATEAHTLHRLSQVTIPMLALTEVQQADLQLRVALRFSALNLEDVERAADQTDSELPAGSAAAR